ncbi:MAG: hypothetical protein RL757_976 [Bacteroidota bacterium]|jgi:membrane protein required for colicin V production
MLIDTVFVAVAAYGFYLGFSEGIVKTVFSVLSIFLGIIAAFKFAPAAKHFLETAFKSQNPLWFAAGFVMMFFIARFLINMIASFLTQTLEWTHINLFNQLAGGTLLTTVFILMYSYVIWFADTARLIKPATSADSFSYPLLQRMPDQASAAFQFVKPMFHDFWQESSKMMDKLDRQSTRSEREEIYNVNERGTRQ